jgi:DNA-binding winged helix-turn-helix (wHTH) protein
MMDRRSFPDDLLGGGFSGDFRPAPLRLIERGEVRIGNAWIDPAARTIAGPVSRIAVEPRIMQVLLALADAEGRVVTRDELIDACWNGQIVGDDAINRAISGARKAARETGADFQIETISKAGYRLAVPDPEGVGDAPKHVSRRAAIGASVAAVATGAVVLWLGRAKSRDPRVAQLIDRGRQALRDDLPDSSEQGVGFLREAVALAPDDAEAWGILALALVNAAEYAPLDGIAAAVTQCEAAARRALALDPRQADARAALVLIRPTYGDWLASEQRMRGLLAEEPKHAATWGALATLMQGAGRCREAVRCNTRAAALEPLSPVYQYRLSYQEWSIGRLGDADRRIDRAMQLWPRHPAVWYARLLLFGMSGRPRPAIAMIDQPDGPPPAMPPKGFAVWRQALVAIDSGSAGDLSAAIETVMKGAGRGSSGSVNAILLLSALGDPDRALAVAEGYLLRKGPLVGALGYAPDQVRVNDQRWRKTMMLFVPVTAPMRARPGFASLMSQMGLADYWRRAGVRPDYQLLS